MSWEIITRIIEHSKDSQHVFKNRGGVNIGKTGITISKGKDY